MLSVLIPFRCETFFFLALWHHSSPALNTQPLLLLLLYYMPQKMSGLQSFSLAFFFPLSAFFLEIKSSPLLWAFISWIEVQNFHCWLLLEFGLRFLAIGSALCIQTFNMTKNELTFSILVSIRMIFFLFLSVCYCVDNLINLINII